MTLIRRILADLFHVVLRDSDGVGGLDLPEFYRRPSAQSASSAFLFSIIYLT